MPKSILEKAFDCIPEGEIIAGEFLTSGNKNVVARVPFFTEEEGIHYVEFQGDRIGDLLVHGNRGGWNITTVPSGTLIWDSHALSFWWDTPAKKSDMVEIAKLISNSGFSLPASLNEFLLGTHLKGGNSTDTLRGIVETYTVQNNKTKS